MRALAGPPKVVGNGCDGAGDGTEGSITGEGGDGGRGGVVFAGTVAWEKGLGIDA